MEKIITPVNGDSEQRKLLGTVVYLAAVVKKRMEEVLKPYNISINQYRVLRGLNNIHPEGIGVYRLREFLTEGEADVSRMVTRFEKIEYVHRQTNENKRSESLVFISPKGMELVAELENHQDKILGPIMQMRCEQCRELNQLLGQLAESYTSN